jgi:hypothetical protein
MIERHHISGGGHGWEVPFWEKLKGQPDALDVGAVTGPGEEEPVTEAPLRLSLNSDLVNASQPNSQRSSTVEPEVSSLSWTVSRPFTLTAVSYLSGEK